MLEQFEAELKMRLRVARILADFRFSHAPVQFVLARALVALHRKSEVMNEKAGLAEHQAVRLHLRSDAFVNAMDEVNPRIATEESHDFVFKVGGIFARLLEGSGIRLRRLVPETLVQAAHVVADNHLIRG